jgi:hypothetical protein
LQKLRRASLIAASEAKYPDSGLYSPAFMRSATFTYFIAGPLAKMEQEELATRNK